MEKGPMTMKNVIGYDMKDILDLVGLEPRRSLVGTVLPAIGFLALGAAIGAGVGLMLAPSSGRRFRQDVGERLDQIRERIKNEAQKQGMLSATSSPQSVGAQQQ
jgi:gas vesicle protein